MVSLSSTISSQYSPQEGKHQQSSRLFDKAFDCSYKCGIGLMWWLNWSVGSLVQEWCWDCRCLKSICEGKSIEWILFTRWNSLSPWPNLCGQCRMQKLIWEAHYSKVSSHFGIGKTIAILQRYFYWPKLRMMSFHIFNIALHFLLLILPIVNLVYIHHFLFLKNLGIQFLWTLCLVFLPPKEAMFVCMLWYISSQKWK